MAQVYISTPIKRESQSKIIQKALEGMGMIVHNPCDIDGVHGDPSEIPRRVVNDCKTMIDGSDMGVLLLDYFGRDCSWEIGYMRGRRMPIYGVYVDLKTASLERLRDLKQYQHSITRIFNSVDAMVAFLSE